MAQEGNIVVQPGSASLTTTALTALGQGPQGPSGMPGTGGTSAATAPRGGVFTPEDSTSVINGSTIPISTPGATTQGNSNTGLTGTQNQVQAPVAVTGSGSLGIAEPTIASTPSLTAPPGGAPSLPGVVVESGVPGNLDTVGPVDATSVATKQAIETALNAKAPSAGGATTIKS